jgi:putative DNA primase/helicase
MSKGNRPPKGAVLLNTTATDVRDISGRVIATQIRKDYTLRGVAYKDFAWKRYGVWGLDGIRETHLPLLGTDQYGKKKGPWFICEGAKAKSALDKVGVDALAVMLGAPKCPDPSVFAFLQYEKSVYLWPDNDEVGRELMRKVARILSALGVEVRWVTWEGAPDKGDAADASQQQIIDLLGDAAIWTDDAPILRLDTADKGTPDSVEWWWTHHIPVGKLGLLDGDPNLGKSVILCDLIASVTTGRALPDGSMPRRTGGAVLFASEDGYGDTVIPRLMAAGADLSKVLVAHAADYGQPIVLPRDLGVLDAAITRMNAALLAFDPWEFYLNADIIKGKEQREAFEPVKNLIAQRKVILIGTRHLNQQSGQKAMYRGRGDMTAGGMSRYGFIVGPDPQSERQDIERVMVPLKYNLSPKSRIHAVQYCVEEVTLSALDKDGKPITAPRIKWNGGSEVTADQVVGTPTSQKLTAKQIMEAKILPQLQNGPILADDGWKIMEQFGITGRGTVTQARKALGIESTKEGNDRWWWNLPGQEVPGGLQVVVEDSGSGTLNVRFAPKATTEGEDT